MPYLVYQLYQLIIYHHQIGAIPFNPFPLSINSFALLNPTFRSKFFCASSNSLPCLPIIPANNLSSSQDSSVTTIVFNLKVSCNIFAASVASLIQIPTTNKIGL